jgi:Flp pilus assembly protein TadG
VTDGRRRDEGQSTVELALVLPFVALLVLAVAQVAVIAHDQLIVLHIAREAARAAAVTDDDPAAAAERAAHAASGLDDARLVVRTVTEDEVVTVSVRYRVATTVVLAGWMVPELDLRADSSMRRETVS